MKTIEISTELYTEINEPSDLSPAFITLWLTENIGRLNVLLNSSYTIDTATSEITPELGENEKVIFKQLFIVYYVGKKLNSVLSTANTDSVIHLEENGAVITRLNKNELAKTYIMLQKEEQQKLKELIFAYRSNNAEPLAVHGKDTDTNDYLLSTAVDRSV